MALNSKKHCPRFNKDMFEECVMCTGKDNDPEWRSCANKSANKATDRYNRENTIKHNRR